MITAEDMLMVALAAGPWPVGPLRDVLLSAGVTRSELERAVRRLRDGGELVMVQQRYWLPGSMEHGPDFPLYVEGHSRAELIRRLSESYASPSPSAHTATTTDELMQGEDAGRLAAYDYAREVESFGPDPL